jgi:hypothetical protein
MNEDKNDLRALEVRQDSKAWQANVELLTKKN